MKKIIEFQKENGLVADGVIGKKTLAFIKRKLNIDSNESLAHFMGQCHHESGGFEAESENLNYGAEGLITTFKSDFDLNKNRVIEANERLKANTLARKPEAIANFVYANQNGNGNEASGDGWRYRGRGAIQLTGKANYQAFANFLKDTSIIERPELVATKYYFESAIFYFNNRKIWNFTKFVSLASIKQVTKLVNGGFNGLDERIDLTNKYYSIITK